MSIAIVLYYKIHTLHICSLITIIGIFLYSIYIMRTRTRTRGIKKRTVKNKRRKTYKRRGGFWNDPSSDLIYKLVTDSAPFTSSGR